MNTNVKTQLKELDKLITASEKLDKKKLDYTGDPSALAAQPNGKFAVTEQLPFTTVGVQHKGFTLEQRALRQLLGRVSVPFFGKGSGATMDSLDWETLLAKYPKQFASIINDLIPQVESKGLLVRTDGKAIRAVLTNKYGIVDNTDVLKAVREVIEPTAKELRDLRVVNSVVDRDRLDMRIVFDNPDRINPETMPQGPTRRGDIRPNQPYGYGVFVTNEETGNGGLAVKALIWRGVCTNSIIVNTAQSIALRHVGASNVLLGRLQQAFADALPVAADTLNRIYAVSNKALPNLTDVISGLAKQYSWTDDAVKQVLVGTEGEETVMGLVNGVSYAASKMETSADRVDMETQAGQILVAPDSLFARAAQQAVAARKG